MEREAFLKRLAAQSGSAPSAPGALHRYEFRQAAPGGDAQRMALFIQRLEALGVGVSTCATLADARRSVELLCVERAWSAVACPPGIRWPGVAMAWTDDASSAPFGLSVADWGIAFTGTVVLSHGGEAQRGFSLIPPTTGIFIHACAVVDFLGDVLQDLARGTDGLPTAVTFVSGPSNTADIASVRCIGAHGPREVLVWIISERRTGPDPGELPAGSAR